MHTRQFTLISVSLLLLLAIAISPCPVVAQTQPAAPVTPGAVPDQATVTAALSSAPVMFVENVGQFGDGARFQVQGGNGAIWLADDALWVTVLEPAPADAATTATQFASHGHRRSRVTDPPGGCAHPHGMAVDGPNPCNLDVSLRQRRALSRNGGTRSWSTGVN